MSYRERREQRRRKAEQVNKAVRLVIPGDPIPQHRARACSRGKHAAVYSDQAQQYADFKVKTLERYPGQPLDGPLEVILFFQIGRPKAHYGTGRNAGTLKASAPKFHTKTPDVDNLAKFTLDACNGGVIWKDDALVASLSAFKRYVEPGETPATIINVRGLD